MKIRSMCCSLLFLDFRRGILRERVSPGAPFDIAPFGFRTADDERQGPRRSLGRAAQDPARGRGIRRGSGSARTPSQVRLQYWHRVWNGKADPLIVERGAGGVGWDAMDDWTNGRWITAKGRVERIGNGYEFTFAPTSSDGDPQVEGRGRDVSQDARDSRRGRQCPARAVAVSRVYGLGQQDPARAHSVRPASGNGLQDGPRRNRAGWRSSTAP